MNTQLKNWLDDDENREIILDEYFCGWGSPATPEGWTTELMDNYGGEDQGSTYYAVWKFTHGETQEEVLIQFDGWYQSFHGSEYEGFFEVEPYEVTKTEYRRIQ